MSAAGTIIHQAEKEISFLHAPPANVPCNTLVYTNAPLESNGRIYAIIKSWVKIMAVGIPV